MVAIKGVSVDFIDDGPIIEKGGYIFYPGFKYGLSKSNCSKRIKVNQFFFVRISRHDDPCIGELVSIWKDKYRDTMLASVRLYFLPEQTPDGRQPNHGQHEVLAASENVILRLHDLVSWITDEVDWVTGLEVPYHADDIDPPAFTLPFLNLINDSKQIAGGQNHRHQHQLFYHHYYHQYHQHYQQKQQQQQPDKENSEETSRLNNNNQQDQQQQQQSRDQQQSSSSSASTTSQQINNLLGSSDSQIGTNNSDGQSCVVVLSYPKYCRYRALLKKMEEMARDRKEKENFLSSTSSSVNCRLTKQINSLSSPSSPLPSISQNGVSNDLKDEANFVRILFCRDTFEHEGLLHHDLNCEHLAPKLKGRPRKRGSSSSAAVAAAAVKISNCSSHDSDTSEENSKTETPNRVRLTRKSSNKVKSNDDDCAFSGSNNNSTSHNMVSKMSLKLAEKCFKNEQEFTKQLNKFMRERNTPITRIPHLGFKKIDLFYLFTFTQKLGGYEKITQNKEWKRVYDELGGDPRSTSAATCTRRHFERLLLPFERHLNEARGIKTGRRSTRGRSLSPLLTVSPPPSSKAGDDGSVGSVGSGSQRRKGVRQSKRLKGGNINSSNNNSSTTSNNAINVTSNNVASTTDEDECDSFSSNDDGKESINDGDSLTSDELTDMKTAEKESKTRSTRSTKDRSTTITTATNKPEDASNEQQIINKQHSSLIIKDKSPVDKSPTRNGNNADNDVDDDKTEEAGLTPNKSRSPSVENNLNSSNVDCSQLERKFSIKSDSTDLKMKLSDDNNDFPNPVDRMTSSKEISCDNDNIDVDKVNNIKSEPIDNDEGDNNDDVKKDVKIDEESLRSIKSENYKTDKDEKIELNGFEDETSNNNRTKNDYCDLDNYNGKASSLSSSKSVNSDAASPLSSISTLISAMDAAKQQQEVHLAGESTVVSTPTSKNTLKSNSSRSVVDISNNKKVKPATINNNSISLSDSRLNLTTTSTTSSLFSSTTNTLPRPLSASGRPSVIQKAVTPIKPCVKVVPTYKDNPNEGLSKDSLLLKPLPPIAHASSYVTLSSLLSTSSPSSRPSSQPSFQSSASVTALNSNSPSLKRKSGLNQEGETIPLDLTCKKRLIEINSGRKVAIPKSEIGLLTATDNNPPILDLSSKVRSNLKENAEKPVNNTSASPTSILLTSINSNHRNKTPVPKVPKSNNNERSTPENNNTISQNKQSLTNQGNQQLLAGQHRLKTSPSPRLHGPSSAAIGTPVTITSITNSPHLNKHAISSVKNITASNLNRSQMVKPCPSQNPSKVKDKSSLNPQSGSGSKDLNHHVNGVNANKHHHPQQQQQQYPIPTTSPSIGQNNNNIHVNREMSKHQEATLNQLRSMVSPENLALAHQTIAQEIAIREMERLHPNLAKQMSQMGPAAAAAAAAAMVGYPGNFYPMLNSVHRPPVPSSPSSVAAISDYNPTLPSFLPFFNSFPMSNSTVPGNGGAGSPGNTAAYNANNVLAAALASGHFFTPASLVAAGSAPFSPLELLSDERFAAAAAAAAAAAENNIRLRGWYK